MDTHFEIFSKLDDCGNSLSNKVLRAGSVLRMMQFRLLEGGKMTRADETDIAALVDVCIESMPHHNGGEIDAILSLNIEYSTALKKQAKRADDLGCILAATRIVAHPNATCEELTKAAASVFEIFIADRTFEPEWLAFVGSIEVRGLHVEVLKIGNLPPRPEVTTKKDRRARRKVTTAINMLVKRVDQQSKVNNKPVAKS